MADEVSKEVMELTMLLSAIGMGIEKAIKFHGLNMRFSISFFNDGHPEHVFYYSDSTDVQESIASLRRAADMAEEAMVVSEGVRPE